ncbi:hypothetical protein [Streptomyces atratus]|uniref:hypothetical protein n=1 Tax=Streptomyces atratus TaxID=1893 RepID=UPI0022522268|nr:hypothetical protein [Streptomyces atratus]MCX5340505.1 hypothetical protein [Streptomyces atratus]
MSALPMKNLSAAVAVLTSLVERFPDLPAAEAAVSTIVPDRLVLSFHNNLGSFEAWRSALDISPRLVRREEESGGGPLMWLRTETALNGVTVKLVGYGHVLVDRSEETTGAPASSSEVG